MFVHLMLRTLTNAMICTTSLLTTTFNKVPYMRIFFQLDSFNLSKFNFQTLNKNTLDFNFFGREVIMWEMVPKYGISHQFFYYCPSTNINKEIKKLIVDECRYLTH
jgi:hypothetical protein